MKLGIVLDGPDIFIRDFLTDWKLDHDVDIFSPATLKFPILSARLNNLIKKIALKRFLSTHDAVFFEWAGPSLILASRLNVKTRILTRLHSWELFEFAPHVNWENVEKVVLVGHAMQRWFKKEFPLQADKTRVIYNGVSIGKFVPNFGNNNGVIGMLGSLLPIKRVYEVILALHELRNLGYNFTLLLGGPAPKTGADDLRYYAALRRMVTVLELEKQVVFSGVIEDPATFLDKVDIFVSNSFWESQHMALVEAMTSGCFCLGHAWDGIEDILPKDNIFYTNGELTTKIIDYWKKSEIEKRLEREQLHNIARNKFDIELLKPKMRALFETGN